MSRVTVALGSFVVGALSMFVCLGNQTSIVAQPAVPQRGIVAEGAEPIVPPLRGIVVSASSFGNLTQPLDGLDLENCEFRNVTLEYSGGAFRLRNASFSGPIRVQLKGAAANTLVLLRFLDAMAASRAPINPEKGKPLDKTTTAKYTQKVDLVSPYGQK